jgi:hypothetical protein
MVVNPALKIALISKVYPMRSHTVAAEGGAAGVVLAHDSLEHHFNDTVSGGDWLTHNGNVGLDDLHSNANLFLWPIRLRYNPIGIVYGNRETLKAIRSFGNGFLYSA